MVVALIVAPICTFIYITVQIDGLCSPVCLRNMNANNLRSTHIHYLNIIVKQDVLIHFVAVEGVPEVRDNLHRLIHTNYLVTLQDVSLLQVFIHAKQNQSANRISESRIGRPNRLRHLRLCPFTKGVTRSPFRSASLIVFSSISRFVLTAKVIKINDYKLILH